MDPLSEILTMLRPRNVKTGATDASGDIAIRFPPHRGMYYYAMLDGACWLTLEGEPPLRLMKGHCVLLPSGRSFQISSDPALTPVDASVWLQSRRNGQVVTYGEGGECFICAAHFDFEGADASLLLSVLPPIVHLGNEEDQAAMRWALERMMAELRAPRAGTDLLVEHLSHLILIQALRLHMAEQDGARAGWLSALGDPPVATVIEAVHAAPARRWTVEAMARIAGMSRTVFALRFKASVGLSPIDYLIRWRMLLAANALKRPRETISSAAFSVGYESESAFSTAFKRVMGCSPQSYRKSAQAQQSTF
ncbi:AraC family transcriptional regulator [Oryzifoliimicrobium ureilyticus]|uniref:AraC family transcriptional regulator n=1 Tax=Oryzifoliimicrobium ureilyticus TaxID=3113724 RepID=UPI0030766C8E